MDAIEHALAIQTSTRIPQNELELPPIRFDMVVIETENRWLPRPGAAPNLNRIDQIRLGNTIPLEGLVASNESGFFVESNSRSQDDVRPVSILTSVICLTCYACHCKSCIVSTTSLARMFYNLVWYFASIFVFNRFRLLNCLLWMIRSIACYAWVTNLFSFAGCQVWLFS